MEHSLLASSVLDEGWLDLVDTSADVLVTAQGLLMYLPPADVHALIVSCANRIRSGALLFDAVSRVLSERSQRGIQGPGGYRPPPWLWGVDGAEREWIARGLTSPSSGRCGCRVDADRCSASRCRR